MEGREDGWNMEGWREGTALAVGSCGGRLSARPQTGWLVAVFTLSTFSCAPISLLFPLLLSSLRTLSLSLSSSAAFVHSLCPLPRPPPPPPRRRFASTSCPPHTQLWHGQTTQHASSVRPRACRPNIEWSLSTFNAEREGEEVPKWGKKKREKDGKLSKKRRCRG